MSQTGDLEFFEQLEREFNLEQNKNFPLQDNGTQTQAVDSSREIQDLYVNNPVSVQCNQSVSAILQFFKQASRLKNSSKLTDESSKNISKFSSSNSLNYFHWQIDKILMQKEPNETLTIEEIKSNQITERSRQSSILQSAPNNEMSSINYAQILAASSSAENPIQTSVKSGPEKQNIGPMLTDQSTHEGYVGTSFTQNQECEKVMASFTQPSTDTGYSLLGSESFFRPDSKQNYLSPTLSPLSTR